MSESTAAQRPEPEWIVPAFTDVLHARRLLRAYLDPTPLHRFPALDAETGTETWVKHENHLPTGSFKVRGGLNLLAQLDERERRAGVICASTGNHGQSIAYAAREFGVRAIVCVPEHANPVKVASMLGFGAEIVTYGEDFDEARVHCETLAEAHGYRYIHSGNEPRLVAGVATYALEMLEREPDLDVILVPVGGGSGAAGVCLAAKTLKPEIQVIAVQSEAAPAAFRSWRARGLLEDRMGTFAEGLATRVGFGLPQKMLWERLDDFVLVSEDEIRRAAALMIETTRNLVEPAGAAALAAALRLREFVTGRRIALVASGGNVSPQQLRALLEAEAR